MEAKVAPKTAAKEKYDDAIASGKAAVYASREAKSKSMTLVIGNLLAGQTAVIKIQVIKPLTIKSGAFEFSMPVSFMPNYSYHEMLFGVADKPLYTFEYEFSVVSDRKVTYLSTPVDCQSSVIERGYRVAKS